MIHSQHYWYIPKSQVKAPRAVLPATTEFLTKDRKEGRDGGSEEGREEGGIEIESHQVLLLDQCKIHNTQYILFDIHIANDYLYHFVASNLY